MATKSNRDKQNDVSRLKKVEPWVFHKKTPDGRYEFELNNIFIGEDFAELPIDTKKSGFDLNLNSENEVTDFKIELVTAFTKKYGEVNGLEINNLEIIIASHKDENLNVTFEHVSSVKIFYKHKKQLLLNV